MPVVSLAAIRGCVAVVPVGLEAGSGRWFGAWSSSGRGAQLLGQGVLDEFGTFSSPVLLCHPSNLGRIYDLGLTLAHRRDPELPIDSGWPPLCLGTASLQPDLPSDWRERLLEALAGASPDVSLLETAGLSLSRRAIGPWQLEGLSAGAVVVVATDAPLLPRQLRQLAAAVTRNLSLAVATGNRLTPSPGGAPLAVRVASEETVEELARAAGRLFA